MTIEEYSEKYNVTYKQVYDRIQKGSLPAIKQGKSWNITLDIAPKLSSKPNSNLKDELTEMQIKKIKQQLSEGKTAIEEAYKHETIEAVMTILEEVKTCIVDLKLDNKQKGVLQACVNRALLQHDSVLRK